MLQSICKTICMIIELASGTVCTYLQCVNCIIHVLHKTSLCMKKSHSMFTTSTLHSSEVDRNEHTTQKAS